MLRLKGWLFTLVMGAAMCLLIGLPGLGLALVAVVHRLSSLPPRSGVWLISEADLQSALWLDESCVVLSKPYRVIYRDEVPPEIFARLRRRCYGLPC